jgi:hypothetical protein
MQPARDGAARGHARQAPSSRSRTSARLACFAIAVFAATAPGQDLAASAPIPFTTPDGSTFVLVPDPGTQLVHWAIATPAEDPPRFPGLALATMRASLSGTWSTGSNEATKERAALHARDEAFHTWFAKPADPARIEALQKATLEADRLGDRHAFRRVLASLPVHAPEVLDRMPACVLVLTTVPEAIGTVGRALVERREQNALRDLQDMWAETTYERAAFQLGHPGLPLQTEVLALAMPDHPFRHFLELASTASPQRTEAMATWQATQRPERSVHVLVGGFEVEPTKALLRQVFAATDLPASAPPPSVVPRPITSLRRSVVTGVPVPKVVLAFVLPPNLEHTLLRTSASWLGSGPDSMLGQQLQRLGRKRATVRCDAPWPPAIGGSGLLRIEVTDPDGIEKLGDQMLQACRRVGGAPPTQAAVAVAFTSVLRDWITVTNEPRELAATLAVTALQWPGQEFAPPGRLEAKAVHDLLTPILAGQPVIVEGRP